MQKRRARELCNEVSAWVRERHDLSALLMVGSWARDQQRDDSDLDLVCLGAKVEHFRTLPFDLIFGSCAVCSDQLIEYGVLFSRHIIFEDGADLELSFAPLDWVAATPLDAGSWAVLSAGYRLLVDKEDVCLNINSKLRDGFKKD